MKRKNVSKKIIASLTECGNFLLSHQIKSPDFMLQLLNANYLSDGI